MAKLHLNKWVPHSADDMLTMVTDVERYPEFLNFISAVRVLEHQVHTELRETFTADVAVRYKFAAETFRSVVDVDRDDKTLKINRAGHGGAVKTLKNIWAFIPEQDGTCTVDLHLEVTMKSMPMEFMLKQKFKSVTNQVMNAFIARAAQVCPKVGTA